MKKIFFLPIVLGLFARSYSINEEWLKKFEQSNFKECLDMLPKGNFSKEDAKIALVKVEKAIEEIKANYSPLIGKTIRHDWLSWFTMLGLHGMSVCLLTMAWSYQRKIIDLKDALDRLTRALTRRDSYNPTMRFLPASYTTDLPTLISDAKKKRNLSAWGFLLCGTIGTILNGYWFIRSKKHPRSKKNMNDWWYLNILKYNLESLL